MGMVAGIMIDNVLKKTIEGKRVAIVGPSPHLVGKSLGAYIDNFDLVCRVNNLPPTNLSKDYGHRTDILFHNTGSIFLDHFKSQMTKDERYKKLKLVYCPVIKAVGSDNIRSIIKHGYSPVSENFPKINIYNLPFKAIDVEAYARYFTAIRAEPNCGFMAIIMLSSNYLSNLFITGFSFYAQGIQAKDSYVEGHRYIFDGYDSSLVGEASHPQKPQIAFFKNFIMKRYSNEIIVDSYLNNLLSLSHSSVLEI